MDPVTTTDGKLEIATKNAGTVEAPKDTVAVLRNDEKIRLGKVAASRPSAGLDGRRQRWVWPDGRKQRDQEPRIGLHRRWAGTARQTIYAGSVYSNNDLATAATRVTANTNRGGARYDRDITPHLFGFVKNNFSPNVQYLNLRGGGRRPWLSCDQTARHNPGHPGRHKLHARELHAVGSSAAPDSQLRCCTDRR